MKPKKISTKIIFDITKNWRPYKTGNWHVYDEFSFQYGTACERRVDLWMIDLSEARGFKKFAFEIKMSASDFSREINNPFKNKLAYEHSNYFYFVAPAGVLSKVKIPHGCGLIEIVQSEYSDGDFFMGNLERPTVKAIYRDAIPPTWGLVSKLIQTSALKFEIETER